MTVSSNDNGHKPQAFGVAARRYYDVGYKPLYVTGTKTGIPDRFTGKYADNQVTESILEEWIESYSQANIAIHAPDGILGIDVDHYGSKFGADTLEKLEARWGKLPPTWRSSARPFPSGIRWFRIPKGLKWPGKAGDWVDLISFRYRYGMVPPSWHFEEKKRYVWFDESGVPDSDVIPEFEDFAILPSRWVKGLTGGKIWEPTPYADLGTGGAWKWLKARPNAVECPTLRAKRIQFLEEIGPNAHDTLLSSVMSFINLANAGHQGIIETLSIVKKVFIGVVTDPDHAGNRSHAKAVSEFNREVVGAIQKVVGENEENGVEPGSECICGFEFEPLTTAEFEEETLTEEERILQENERIKHKVREEKIRLKANELARIEIAAERIRNPIDENSFVSAEDLFVKERDKPKFLVENLLGWGHNVVLGAKYKTGKTTFGLNLVKSLVGSGEFLGRRVGDFEGNISWWNAEMEADDLIDYMKPLGWSKAELSRVKVGNFRSSRHPILDDDYAEKVIKIFRDQGIGIWIIDSWRRLLAWSGIEQNDNDGAELMTARIDEIKEAAGIHCCFPIAHLGRKDHEAGEEHVRGATALDDWQDARWILTKNEDGIRFFYAEGRQVEFGETALEFDRVHNRISLGAGNRNNHISDTSMFNVVAIIRENPRCSKRIILEGLGWKTNGRDTHKLNPIIKKLLDDGVIFAEPHNGNDVFSVVNSAMESRRRGTETSETE